MARIIDYPRASLKNALEVAVAVDSLGGKCTGEMAADKLNKKISGAWQALVGSSIKYGLLNNGKGTLEVTALFRDYKLGYDAVESNAALLKAFLMPPLFMAVVDRFDGKELPTSHFEKLLIREFHVPEDNASRVSKYFIEGAKLTGLLTTEGRINYSVNTPATTDKTDGEGLSNYSEKVDSETEETPNVLNLEKRKELSPNEIGVFSVRIMGPGMDSLILINDAEDLLIVKAMLKKIEKKLPALEQESDV